jgi:acyl carrier protein
MSRERFEGEVLRIFARVVAPDVDRKRITLDAAFKTELRLDSLGLFSLVYRIEEAFGIDLFQHAEKLSEAELVREIVEISFQAYTEKNGARR